MSGNVRKEFERFISTISGMAGVVRIYLFGSYAYGKPDEDSDIDLFVVVDDEVDKLKFMGEAQDAFSVRTVALDLIADNVTSFETACNSITLQREISKNGVVVYDIL